MRLHPYKVHCCSPSHFQVFQVVRGFSTGVYNKEEFKSKLQNIDLSDLEDYREHIKTLIKDVLKEDNVETVENVKTVEENETVEEVIVEKDMIVETTETVEIIKPRKRNYKVDKVETE